MHRVSLSLDTRVHPVDPIVHRLTPPRRLQGRLGGVVIRRRSADAQEYFHEKLIVAYALVENADSNLLSLFWLAFLEWNLVPPRRANTIIMTDASGRTGLDNAHAATHDKNTDWSAVGGSDSETTTANGREMVNLCYQARPCFGNIWGHGDPTAFTPMSPSGHRLDYIAFRRERLDVAEIETCCELGKGPQLSSHYHHVPVHVPLLVATLAPRHWTEILLAPLEPRRLALGGEMICCAKLVVPVPSTPCRLCTLQILTCSWMIGMEQ